MNYEDYEIKSGGAFKLKDNPPNRAFQIFDLKKEFGKLPEAIAIQKIDGKNNAFIIRAFIPKEGDDNEEKR